GGVGRARALLDLDVDVGGQAVRGAVGGAVQLHAGGQRAGGGDVDALGARGAGLEVAGGEQRGVAVVVGEGDGARRPVAGRVGGGGGEGRVRRGPHDAARGDDRQGERGGGHETLLVDRHGCSFTWVRE